MSKRGKSVFYSVLILIIVGLIIKNIYEANRLNKNGVYVIGKIENVKGASRGRGVNIVYMYKGSLFRNYFVTDQIHMSDKGRRFFLEIDTIKPQKFSIQYNVPVPDSLLESPYNGWDTLPVALYQVR